MAFNTIGFCLNTTARAPGPSSRCVLSRKERSSCLGWSALKFRRLETVDDLKHRIDRASKYLPLEQLAISPQCGFASDVVGNLISEDDQRRKLEVVVETARQVWGTP